MGRRQIAHRADLEFANVVQNAPKILSDGDYLVIGKEEFQTIGFLLVGKTEGIETCPGEGPFLRLPWVKGDHSTRLKLYLYTGRNRGACRRSFGKKLS